MMVFVIITIPPANSWKDANCKHKEGERERMQKKFKKKKKTWAAEGEAMSKKWFGGGEFVLQYTKDVRGGRAAQKISLTHTQKVLLWHTHYNFILSK